MIIRFWNWLRGYRFYWRNGTLECSPGTCPYPLRHDWSAKACIKNNDCGCDEKRLNAATKTTNLDELKALMTSHQENPDLNYQRYIFKEALYDNASALIAAVEALEELIAVENIDYNDLPEPEFQTFEKRYDAARKAARAALAPFGERLWLKNRMLAGHLCM